MADVLSKGSIFNSCESYSKPISGYRGSRPFFPSRCVRSSSSSSSWNNNVFFGKRLSIENRNGNLPNLKLRLSPVEMALTIGKAMRWWVKGLQPNMREITSAQDLVDSLSNAGNKLVIVDFFSPGCGGCKSLHPKICQFAEKNPDIVFLQVNYEEHKSMCYSLNIHVLPFFRFYRGAHGRLCSFSCTNTTIKKFKDALAKHSTERCSLGPAKGLEESELVALDADKNLHFCYCKKEVPTENDVEVMKAISAISKLSFSQESSSTHELEDKALVVVGR